MTKTNLFHIFVLALEQVTRGHNIAADEWAGASNPHPNVIVVPNQHKVTILRIKTQPNWQENRVLKRSVSYTYKHIDFPSKAKPG